jgi:hypothetical protein
MKKQTSTALDLHYCENLTRWKTTATGLQSASAVISVHCYLQLAVPTRLSDFLLFPLRISREATRDCAAELKLGVCSFSLSVRPVSRSIQTDG